jgi:hypothetical protein
VIITDNTVGAAVRQGTAALVALAVCACAQEKPKPIEENIYPTDYKAQIADRVRAQLNTQNIRDAYIAEPALKTSLSTPRYIACLRVKAADSSGAYKDKNMAAYFYAGRVTQVVDASAELCGNAAFQPFRELQ